MPGTAADLKKVYQSLNARLVLERKETEITFLFAAVAAGAAARGVLLLAPLVQSERLIAGAVTDRAFQGLRATNPINADRPRCWEPSARSASYSRSSTISSDANASRNNSAV